MDFLTGIVMAVGAEIGTAVHEKNLVDWDKSAIVVGVDQNNNGLRDDFEKMLVNRVADDKTRNMLFHMLGYMNEAIVFGSTKTEKDTEEALQIFKKYELGKIFQCLPRQEQNMYTYIEKNYANTAERKAAYHVFNMAFAKSGFRSRTPRTNCDEFTASIPNYTVNQLVLNGKAQTPQVETQQVQAVKEQAQ